MTYNVSMGTLNPTIPYLIALTWWHLLIFSCAVDYWESLNYLAENVIIFMLYLSRSSVCRMLWTLFETHQMLNLDQMWSYPFCRKYECHFYCNCPFQCMSLPCSQWFLWNWLLFYHFCISSVCMLNKYLKLLSSLQLFYFVRLTINIFEAVHLIMILWMLL